MADQRDVFMGVGVGATLALIAAEALHRAQQREIADQKPARLQKVDPRSIKADPETFQFKSGGDAYGVTDRLKGVTQWDPVAAGKTVVWERADGERFIADGHQRRGLALRSIEAGQKNVRLDAYVMREREGWKPRDVRAYAALKNMKESSGNALDMAKVVRERPDLVNGSVPMSDGKVKEAVHLSRLSQPAFDMVANGLVKPEIAAAVGEIVKEPSSHAGLLSDMKQAEVASAQHARLYVAQSLAAPAITETTDSLFGEEKQTRSLLKERAQVLDRALTALKSDKKLFGLLEREAANIESVGNRLAHETNVAKAEGAGRTAALVEKLSTTRGPVSSMLDEAAKAVAAGETPSKAARKFVSEVGGTLKAGGMAALMGGDAKPAVVAPTEHQLAADAGQKSMLDESSHLRGTQNPENLNAIVANKKAKDMARKTTNAQGGGRAAKSRAPKAPASKGMPRGLAKATVTKATEQKPKVSKAEARLVRIRAVDATLRAVGADLKGKVNRGAEAELAGLKQKYQVPTRTKPQTRSERKAEYLRSPAGQTKLAAISNSIGEMQAILKTPAWRAKQEAAGFRPSGIAEVPAPSRMSRLANTYGVTNTALGLTAAAVAGVREFRQSGSVGKAAWVAAPALALSLGHPVGEALGRVGRGMTSLGGELMGAQSFGGILAGNALSALDHPIMGAAMMAPGIAGAGIGVTGLIARGAGAILRGASHIAAPALAAYGAHEGAKEDANKTRGAIRGGLRALDPTSIFMHRGLAERAVDRIAGGPARLSDSQATDFAAANNRYKAMRQASGESDAARKRRGWSNAARIGAARARGAQNLPYGGDPTQGPEAGRSMGPR